MKGGWQSGSLIAMYMHWHINSLGYRRRVHSFLGSIPCPQETISSRSLQTPDGHYTSRPSHDTPFHQALHLSSPHRVISTYSPDSNLGGSMEDSNWIRCRVGAPRSLPLAFLDRLCSAPGSTGVPPWSLGLAIRADRLGISQPPERTCTQSLLLALNPVCLDTSVELLAENFHTTVIAELERC